MNRLDLATPWGITLALLPEVILTAWTLVVLLVVSWRHETAEDSRLAGWLSFAAFPWATGIATTGVIFAAASLLWALQRLIFNRLDDGENEHLTDLTARELAVMLPLVAGIVWLGLYPAPVLRRMEPATRHYLEAAAPRPRPATDVTLGPPAGGTSGGSVESRR